MLNNLLAIAIVGILGNAVGLKFSSTYTDLMQKTGNQINVTVAEASVGPVGLR